MTYFIWMIALLSTAGSLFFSEIMDFPPCVLCWYQRIAMFPIALLLGMGLFRNDKSIILYCIPLALIGLLLAGYHNLLYYGLIAKELSPCTANASCTEVHLSLFGFISIPLLSLGAFSAISFGLIWMRIKKESR